MRTGYLGGTLLLVALVAPAFAAPVTPAKAPAKTITDLKAAYKGETTAHAKYAAYARQADKEGYRNVAALFRAASRAEEVHARDHKAALASLGVKNPQAGSYTARPGATRENLKDAIKGETYEKDTMYPRMLKDAATERQPEATRAFTYARAAERQHANLYASALKNLSQREAARPYYVCPVCGATFARTAPAACPQCGTPREQFQRLT